LLLIVTKTSFVHFLQLQFKQFPVLSAMPSNCDEYGLWPRNGVSHMALTPMCLRLESSDGQANEYRIRQGTIEVRELQAGENEGDWQRVTPEQLTDHVNRNTVVAQWLMRRLGWRRLLRACVTDWELYAAESGLTGSDRRAA
jgi:hypothetical protein